MKPIKSLLVLAIILAPAIASAQYYGGGPGYYNGPDNHVPGGFHNRTGRLAYGFSIGLGGMHDDGSGITNCDNCANAPALELDFHIGGMLGPRFALMFEGQLNARTVHSDVYNGDTTLSQTAPMIAGQFWITPQLWVKGGLGVAALQADSTYVTYDYGTGMAVMGAVGFELMSARYFALDLQGRIIEGTYNSGNDHVTAANIGLGFNWY
ncbi:MAG TPA: hypothetical protein VFQ65_19925 [Kofleriaceae bacterium]|nr:hypothetical protein [Kofleriaceae bacterium]